MYKFKQVVLKTLALVCYTIIVAVATTMGIFAFLRNEGNATIEERKEAHTKEVYIDGELTESENWEDKLGYDLSINLVDSVYIGK